MKEIIFKSRPRIIKAVRFFGETEAPEWLKVCGTKIPKSERVGKFWNRLYDRELEVEYGEWIVVSDINDLYPIKNIKLMENYKIINKEASELRKIANIDALASLNWRVAKEEKIRELEVRFNNLSKANAGRALMLEIKDDKIEELKEEINKLKEENRELKSSISTLLDMILDMELDEEDEEFLENCREWAK